MAAAGARGAAHRRDTREADAAHAGSVVRGYLLEDAISSAHRVLAWSWNERRKCAGKG